jgi:hypothetical protein
MAKENKEPETFTRSAGALPPRMADKPDKQPESLVGGAGALGPRTATSGDKGKGKGDSGSKGGGDDLRDGAGTLGPRPKKPSTPPPPKKDK